MEDKVYISGQIRGLPYEDVRAKFNAVEERLTEQGLTAVNPLKNGIPINAPWELHVAMDICLLMACSTIYLLPCWSNSKGATLEKAFAELTGKKIIFEETPLFPKIKQAIADAMGVSFHDIVGRKRSSKVVYARMIYAYLCREKGTTIVSIAKDMKHNHATVLYYLKKFNDDSRFTPEFREYVAAVESKLKD